MKKEAKTLLDEEEFAGLMAQLGPFARRPRLAAAVSGGADSLAVAWLGARWARGRGGDLVAFVVDHGLRDEAAGDAAQTVKLLADIGISARILTLAGLVRGSALAARARAARYLILACACREAGLTDLLLGHHAGDQAETLMIRALAGSAAAGFAGMAAQRETAALRLLRPLLAVPAARLRATLEAVGLHWIDDPSNRDRTALRGRLRAARGESGEAALTAAAGGAGLRRARADQARATLLARRVTLFPEGFAAVSRGALPPEALAALLGMISGAAAPVSPRRVARLAACPAPATIAGVRLVEAGGELLLVREAAAQAAAIPARRGALWDGRFRLLTPDIPGGMVGALGTDAPRWRRCRDLPAAVLQTLPAIRCNGAVAAIPHLGYAAPDYAASAGATRVRLLFSPAGPACGAPWLPSSGVTAGATGAIGDA